MSYFKKKLFKNILVEGGIVSKNIKTQFDLKEL